MRKRLVPVTRIKIVTDVPTLQTRLIPLINFIFFLLYVRRRLSLIINNYILFIFYFFWPQSYKVDQNWCVDCMEKCVAYRFCDLDVSFMLSFLSLDNTIMKKETKVAIYLFFVLLFCLDNNNYSFFI